MDELANVKGRGWEDIDVRQPAPISPLFKYIQANSDRSIDSCLFFPALSLPRMMAAFDYYHYYATFMILVLGAIPPQKKEIRSYVHAARVCRYVGVARTSLDACVLRLQYQTK